ncbi:MAG: hypothetical protein NVSMB9_14540 [Isosphaeraceae bacterium]
MSVPFEPNPMNGPSTKGPGPGDFPQLGDLPPVEAPSAGFIVQLFVIPAVIVLVVILVWLLFGKLAGGERDAMEYVRLIRSSDTNWRAGNRAAFELASLIQNDARLASDSRLLGELTDLLEHDLDSVANPEMTKYVALALGRFQTLDAVSSTGQPIDPLSALDRALDAKYPLDVRIAASASLAKHAARLNGKLDDPRPIAALTKAAEATEPEARQMAVYALGFFGGDASAKALRAQLNDEDRFVRYNAAVALARRGDESALETFREMLSFPGLEKAVALKSPTETSNKVESIELEALQALQTAVDSHQTALARSLRPEIEALSRSGLVNVRNKALALLNQGQARKP